MGAEKEKVSGHTIFSAVVVAAGILLYLWMFHNIGFQSGRNQERARIESEHYAAQAADDLSKKCGGLGGADLRKCVYETAAAQRESERNESDLAAQWQTADWARLAAVVAGLQLIATIIGLVFIKGTLDATWKAVEDTSEATDAMRESNTIAREAQRAWVTLSMDPHQVAPLGNGLYFRVDFLAKNVGQTNATHFGFENDVVFKSPDETANDVAERIKVRFEEWRAKYDMGKDFSLFPGDTAVGSFWDDREPPILNWWPGHRCQPIFFAAVFYRTATQPDIIQASWQAWYLLTFQPDGQKLSWIPKKELGIKELCAETMRTSISHEEYEATDEA